MVGILPTKHPRFQLHKSPPWYLPLSNFEYSGFSDLKIDSMVGKVRKTKQNKKNSIQAAVNEHNQNKDGW